MKTLMVVISVWGYDLFFKMSCILPVSVCGCAYVCVFYGQQEALVWFGLVWFLRH